MTSKALLIPLVLLSATAVPVLAQPKAGDATSQIVVTSRVGNFGGLVRYAPMPEMPAAAIQQRLSGHGVYAVDIGVGGLVDDVRVVRSAGHRILDQAALTALRKWVVVPHKLYKITVPLDFGSPAGAH